MTRLETTETEGGSQAAAPTLGSRALLVRRTGRIVALAGAVLPLLMIGILKFTPIEIDALEPLVGGTPWLAWLYPALGEAGTSYLLGVVEIAAALLLLASPWSPRAAIAGGALGALTFFVTTTILFALPIWEVGSGGFPWLNATGSFLIKDVALLGIALVVLGEGLGRVAGHNRSHGTSWASLVQTGGRSPRSGGGTFPPRPVRGRD